MQFISILQVNRGICLAAICGFLLLAATEGSEPVRVVYISRFVHRGYAQNRAMTPDPSISLLPIPMPGHHQLADGADVNILNRYMRIYFPRSYGALVGNHDMVVMFEAPCGLSGLSKVQFDPKWMSWMVRGIAEDGLSVLMMGGDACWGGGQEGSAFYKSWGETILDEVLPFDSLVGTNPATAASNRPSFVDPEHPLNVLPWEGAGPVELLNKVLTRQGATLIAQAIGDGGIYPWISAWRYGQGKVVGETQIHWSKETTNVMFDRWEWYPDFIVYLMYFGVDKPIPEDILLVHDLRVRIREYTLRISLLVSLLEFVEDFGANIVSLYGDLDLIQERYSEAGELYRSDDYQGTA